MQVGDRKLVQERMVRHVQQPDATPLLVFPEGTCGARVASAQLPMSPPSPARPESSTASCPINLLC